MAARIVKTAANAAAETCQDYLCLQTAMPPNSCITLSCRRRMPRSQRS
jgi:hypothetical protein